MPGIKRITGAADLASEGEPGSWVSDAAREKFMAAYERAFALWPQPCEEFDVETATATTRVHAYRPHPGGDPVVLLTGAGGNAAAWFPHVAALAGDGPVYGIDMPGDANPSVPRALMTPPASCAAWLDELLAQAQRPPGAPGGLLLRRLGRHEPGDPRTRAGRLHHAARPRRAHQARRPLLVVVLHQRPGQPDPDAAAPPPRPVAGQPGHAGAGADDAHVGRHPRLPGGAEVPRRPHRRRTPRDHRAGPADHRRAQRPAHPGARPAPGEASCRTRRSPSSPAATAASTASTS